MNSLLYDSEQDISTRLKQEDLTCDITSRRKSIKKDHAGKRRRRMFTPLIYLLLELIAFWLFISLFNLTLDIKEWFLIAIVFFIGFTFNSLKKTLNVYERQKNYPTVQEA